MKKRVIVSVVIAAVLVGAAAVVWADTRNSFASRSWCGRQSAFRFGAGPLGFVAHELNLSDTQQKQIETLVHAERQQFAALVREFAQESAEMKAAHAAGANGNVESIAAQQGATVARLLVEKEHLRGEIYTQVLNADQRKKADDFETRMQSHLESFANRLSETSGEK